MTTRKLIRGMLVAVLLCAGARPADAQSWKWPGKGPGYDPPPPPPVKNVEPPPPPQKNSDEAARAAAAKYAEACGYNRRGVELCREWKWELAVEAFAAAVNRAPGDAQMRDNLEKSRKYLAEYQAFLEQKRLEEKRNAEAAVEVRKEILELARGLDFDGRSTGGSTGLPIRRAAGDVNSDPMLVDLRDRLRDSINADSVSGGHPPAGSAGGLPIRRAGADERPTLADIARRRALEPQRQEYQLAKAVAHLQGRQTRAPISRVDIERTMQLIMDAYEKSMEEKNRQFRAELARRPGFMDALKRIGFQMNDHFNESESLFAEELNATVQALEVSGAIREGESTWVAMTRDPGVRETMFTTVVGGIQKMNKANMVAILEALEACGREIKEGERR